MLNLPGGTPRPDIPVLGSKIPKPEEIVMVSQPVLQTVIKLGEAMKDAKAKWAVGGDAGEVMLGVNLQADHVEIITTREGTEEICRKLAEYATLAPGIAEKKLDREADVEAKLYSVRVKSYYAELTIEKVKVEVYGDEQIKVGEWEWGDSLDFEPTFVYVVGKRVPLVPLTLKSELALGLGWLDRVELISEAVIRSQHRH